MMQKITKLLSFPNLQGKKRISCLTQKNLVLLLLFLLTSCHLNYSVGTDNKMKTKTIEGKDYIFSNLSKEKEFGFSFFKRKDYKNEISFYGLGQMISKEIDLDAIEKKMNKRNIDFIMIDSISFSINKKKTEIDLIYYFNLFESKEKVIFNLKREKNKWDLH